MTEAQKCLYHIAENMRMDKSISKEGYGYFQQAIKALEQEPTTKNDLGVDTVSRKEVHDMLENLPITVEDKWFNWLQKACMRLAELPSVTPQEPKSEEKMEVIERIIRDLSTSNAYAMPSFWCNKGKDYRVIPTKYHKGYMQALEDVEREVRSRFGFSERDNALDKYKAESEDKK